MTSQIIFGLGLFVLAVVWAWRDLRGPLFLLIALLPLNHKELFNFGLWNLTPDRVVLLGILISGFARLLVAWVRRGPGFAKKAAEFVRDPVLAILLALWLIRLISIVNSRNLYASFSLLAFYSAIIGLYVVLKWLSEKYGRDFLRSLFRFYLAVVLVSMGWAFLQYLAFYLLKVTLPGAVWPTEYQPLRVGSFFWDINHYAAYLSTAIPVLGLLAADRQAQLGAKGAAKFWGLFGFSLLVLVMTLSRSGWGAVLCSFPLLVLLLLVRSRTQRLGVILVEALTAVVLVAVLGSVFLGLPIVSRLGTLFDTYNSDSIKAHFSVLRGVAELFVKNPIIGVGYGNFAEHFASTNEAAYYFSKDPVSWQRIPAHSIWGEVLAETGILGFSAYLTLFVLMLIRLTLSIWRSKADQTFLLGSWAAILGLLFSGIFYSYNLVFFWFFVFLAYVMAETAQEQ